MIKRWFSAIIAFLFLVTAGSAAMALQPFRVTQYVTDQAQVLSESDRAALSNQLGLYAQKTGNQFLVITVSSLEDEDLTDFTEKLFELNKPGEKGKDNGLILLIAMKERKIRFETGYGLEEKLPDGKAGAIIRDDIAPYFKTGDYYGGISTGINAAIAAVTPDYQPESGAQRATAPKKDTSLPAAFVVAMIIFFISLLGGRGSHRRRYGRGYSEPWYWGGGGGFGGSGGGGFGGGDSGGFSGGGGSFGGGGASGGW